MDIWKFLKPVRHQSMPDVEGTTLTNDCKKPKTDDAACSTTAETLLNQSLTNLKAETLS